MIIELLIIALIVVVIVICMFIQRNQLIEVSDDYSALSLENEKQLKEIERLRYELGQLQSELVALENSLGKNR